MKRGVNGVSINLSDTQLYSSGLVVITMCTVLANGLWCRCSVELLMAEE